MAVSASGWLGGGALSLSALSMGAEVAAGTICGG